MVRAAATEMSANMRKEQNSDYLPLKGGGRRATSAFTRVFDALWRGGGGSIMRPIGPPPPPPPFKGRERTTRVAPRAMARLQNTKGAAHAPPLCLRLTARQ